MRLLTELQFCPTSSKKRKASQTNIQVFVVDKSTIEGGTVEEIRNKLSAFVKDKYILCKY